MEIGIEGGKGNSEREREKEREGEHVTREKTLGRERDGT